MKNVAPVDSYTDRGRIWPFSGPPDAKSTGEIFYDVSIIHELAPSNQSKTCVKLMQDVIRRKKDTYVTTCMIPEFAFQCLPIFSCGSLHQNTRFLIHALADAAMLDRKTVEMDFKLLLQDLNGNEVYAQLRQFLGSSQGKTRMYASAY